ncbi:hypothetical protein T492DRAFT_914030 [Pavlovales sp. CCMP2436]|nr:hypothetical protein T492DRAFT_914030 [Pavlovales sp. CCMP2436]
MEPALETEPAVTLDSLPTECLSHICCQLVPASLIAGPVRYRDLFSLAASSRACAFAASEALADTFLELVAHGAVPTYEMLKLPRSALTLDSAHTWKPCRAAGHSSGLQPIGRRGDPRPDERSGASLVALGPRRLCLFGGRVSSNGSTLGDLHFAHLSPLLDVVEWQAEQLLPGEGAAPRARCYHLASGGVNADAMIVFGGSGDASDLLGDTWVLECECPRLDYAAVGGPIAVHARHRWRELVLAEGAPAPSARSSLVGGYWAERGSLLLHGGMDAQGTCGDVWALPVARAGAGGAAWERLQLSGAVVVRAHHCGTLVGSSLVVVGGQDASLLTQAVPAVLCLRSLTWSLLTGVGTVGERIDACAAPLPCGTGVLVFGGVDAQFDFCPDNLWVLRLHQADPPPQTLAPPLCADPGGKAEPVVDKADGEAATLPPMCPAWSAEWLELRAGGRAASTASAGRACVAICAAGASIFQFGGFDGDADSAELLHLRVFAPLRVNVAAHNAANMRRAQALYRTRTGDLFRSGHDALLAVRASKIL